MKSVANAMEVLSLFSEKTPSISVSEVSVHLNIPKSSSSRLLSTMRRSQIIEQPERGGKYKLGPLARKIGTLYSNKYSVKSIIRTGMQTLAAEIRHSCWMSVLSGQDIVVIDGVHGGYPVRLVVEPGSHLPAHGTAAGKALLARLGDDRVRALFEGGALRSFTRNTLTSIDDLLAELDVVRTRLWADTHQEVIDGIRSIGVSFSVPGEGADIALSVSFPLANVSEVEQDSVLEALLETARSLGQRIGDPTWTGGEADRLQRNDA